MNTTEARQNETRIIEETLSEFDIHAKVVATAIGLRFTRYTLQLPSGVTTERVASLEANIALNLRAIAIRISQSSEDDGQMYVEIPNGMAAWVSLGELANRLPDNSETTSSLDFIVGQDVEGSIISADLAKMPHLLIGGQTGSGKSTMLHAILANLLSGKTPNDLRVVLIDPKQVEFGLYSDLPHLLQPVATKPEEWMDALRRLEQEVVRRLKLLADSGSAGIDDYNRSATEALPRIVVVSDELSDMMMANGTEVERIISAITPSAMATGVHLIISTSRPSSDVYTDGVKKSFSTRIAFTMASKIDSHSVLEESGAEKLLGRGDMLFKGDSDAHPLRLQGAYVSDEDIEQVIKGLAIS